MASDINCSGTQKDDFELVRHAIDMEELDLGASEYTIYSVPCNLRKLNEEAYTPQLISIGPLHFDQKKLSFMQTQKARYLQFFYVRVDNDEAKMKNYKMFLERSEEDIRHCYAVEFPDISKQKFVDMLLLDAVFIMELFLRTQESHEENEDDIILKQTWLNKSIQRDLLLLENQIPFFILDKLYNTVVPDTVKEYHRFVDMVDNYFGCFRDPDQSRLPSRKHLFWNRRNKPKHFTDFIRGSYVKDLNQRNTGLPSDILRSATKLQEAGVSIEKVNDRHLLDIRFDEVRILRRFPCLVCIPKFTFFESRFQIPQLKIDHITECVLRNLIALEMCHYPESPYICNYVSLFDSLMHTDDDFKLLVEKEVIVHTLGRDTEVANLMNGLCKNVVTNETCYKQIIDDLNGQYKWMWWKRNMATLRLVYFRDLWRASSTIIGVVFFMFTILSFYRDIVGFIKNKE